MTPNALTIDLEDWHQLIRRRLTGELGAASRDVEADTHRILDVLDEAKIRATFFVVGHIVEAYPELVREVARRGHEIGSHTHNHEMIYSMTWQSFEADMERSRKELQDLTGQSVRGFRAPEFSVGNLKHWCFDVLVRLGFRYDSSVFPFTRARYGIPSAPRHPFTITTASGSIREFPLATWESPLSRLPVAGGSYFRLLPRAVLRRALAEMAADDCPAVLYFHPYEFHRGWIYLSGLSWRRRLSGRYLKPLILYNFGTGLILHRLRPLITKFRFVTLGEMYDDDSLRAR